MENSILVYSSINSLELVREQVWGGYAVRTTCILRWKDMPHPLLLEAVRHLFSVRSVLGSSEQFVMDRVPVDRREFFLSLHRDMLRRTLRRIFLPEEALSIDVDCVEMVAEMPSIAK